MIKFYQYQPAFGIPNPSPFCMKLEAYLNLCELEYETVWMTDPRKAPKGKGPYIEIDGQAIGDTALIIDALKTKTGVDPDAQLSSEQRASAHALGVMLEEHLYFAVLRDRWMVDESWAKVKDVFFSSMPFLVRDVLPAMVRRQVRKALHGQGMGRHSEAELVKLGTADIDALSTHLGDKPFMMGANATTVDCIAIGFVANLIKTPFEGPFNRHARQIDNLVHYNERAMARLFPNWSDTANEAA